MYNSKKIFILLFTLLILSPCLASNDKKKLIFGIHPYLHATTLIERFTPLTEYLSSQMGLPIHIRIATSYQDHINAIANGSIDFAYIGPATYVKLTEVKSNYPLLGRLSFSGKNTFHGTIIVRKNSSINQISQLQGKKFAFGDPNSTLSSLVPQQLLANAGIQLNDLESYTHLKNHHNVALAVLMGKADAGGIKEEVFYEYEARGLKVLQFTQDVPSHSFIATSKMTERKINTLQNLLQNIHIEIKDSSKIKNILQKIKKGTTAIIPAHSEDYNELRKLILPLNKINNNA